MKKELAHLRATPFYVYTISRFYNSDSNLTH